MNSNALFCRDDAPGWYRLLSQSPMNHMYWCTPLGHHWQTRARAVSARCWSLGYRHGSRISSTSLRVGRWLKMVLPYGSTPDGGGNWF